MRNGNKLALTALIAAAAGYIGGLMSAPRSGKQTRKKLAKTANKKVTDAEKQLKKLYSEINDNISQAERKVTKARTKANNELRQRIDTAKQARQKARELLSALRDGDADDPDLKQVIKEVSSAKKRLGKFIKSKS